MAKQFKQFDFTQQKRESFEVEIQQHLSNENLFKCLNVKGIENLPAVFTDGDLEVTVSELVEWAHTQLTSAPNETRNGCYDCRMPYSDFPDMDVPDDVWKIINPSKHEGGGLLCPTCTAKRMDAAGLWYKSGMFQLKKTEIESEKE